MRALLFAQEPQNVVARVNVDCWYRSYSCDSRIQGAVQYGIPQYSIAQCSIELQ